MLNKYPFLHFLTLLLFKQKVKHMGVMLISVVMITLIGSVLFISTSLQHTLQETIENQADFTVKKIEAGRPVTTPLAWVDEIMGIEGCRMLHRGCMAATSMRRAKSLSGS